MDIYYLNHYNRFQLRGSQITYLDFNDLLRSNPDRIITITEVKDGKITEAVVGPEMRSGTAETIKRLLKEAV